MTPPHLVAFKHPLCLLVFFSKNRKEHYLFIKRREDNNYKKVEMNKGVSNSKSKEDKPKGIIQCP
jgi:hypothetical protein